MTMCTKGQPSIVNQYFIWSSASVLHAYLHWIAWNTTPHISDT